MWHNGYSFFIFQTIIDKLSENGFFITSLKKIECLFCKEYFDTKEELGSHLLSHKGMYCATSVLFILHLHAVELTHTEHNHKRLFF